MADRGWQCSACRAKNDPAASNCESCGNSRPDKAHAGKKKAPGVCSVDGYPLDDQGHCDSGRGFVAAAPCPFVCPLCRHALTWEGRCFACFGCSTAKRGDWTVPGDRYELHRGHWALAEKGPKLVCTFEQQEQALKIVTAVLDHQLTEEQAREMIGLVLG